MAKRIERCRKHPSLEAMMPKYRKGVPLEKLGKHVTAAEGGQCTVCLNEEAVEIIGRVAAQVGMNRKN